MENTEIRMELLKTGLRQWQVAAALGMSETTFSRRLRRELPARERERVLGAIRELAGGTRHG